MLPRLEGGGGGHKKFWIRNFPILLPPLTVINDQPLIVIGFKLDTTAVSSSSIGL